MATTTASRAARGKSAPAVKVAPDDILRIAEDVTENVLVERKNEMRVIVLASLAGVNVHQLGHPGTGKSLGIREFCKRIIGARYFEKAVHAQMPADAIVGGYDMPKFAQTGEFSRNVEHYAPNAHVIFLDEVTRANGPTLDALLPLLNTEERAYEANGGMKTAPALFVATASNYMPDPDDAHLGAFVDRITLMQFIDYVKADDSFKEMVRRHHVRRQREAGAQAYEPKTVTLEQFQQAQREVSAIEPSPEYLEAISNLRVAAKTEAGLNVSDRAWMELGRVARSSAWLAGRDFLIPEDLVAVENGLWKQQADIPAARKLILPLQGRFEREAEEKAVEASKPMAEWEQIRPQVEAAPPHEDLEQALLSKCINVGRSIEKVLARVDAVLGEAKKEGRDAARLRDLRSELRTIQRWFKDNNLPNKYDEFPDTI